jgi:hypothetical protein
VNIRKWNSETISDRCRTAGTNAARLRCQLTLKEAPPQTGIQNYDNRSVFPCQATTPASISMSVHLGVDSNNEATGNHIQIDCVFWLFMTSPNSEPPARSPMNSVAIDTFIHLQNCSEVSWSTSEVKTTWIHEVRGVIFEFPDRFRYSNSPDMTRSMTPYPLPRKEH